MITYEHKQLTLRLPTDLYNRLKDIRNDRIIEAIHSKGTKGGDYISLHSMIIEAIEKKFPREEETV